MDPNHAPNQQKPADAGSHGFSQLNLSGRENSFVADDTSALENRMLSGANWFFWIAALSIVNSVIVVMDGSWSFLAGLGMTQVIDGIVQGLTDGSGQAAKVLAIILNIPLAGLFAVFGYLSRKRQNWAFISGMALYAFDGLIFLYVQDWLGVGFHVFALYCIFQGLRANNKLKEIEEERPRAIAKGA
jgi:hypothetical protein